MLPYILSFVSGALVKIVDIIDDEIKTRDPRLWTAKWLIAIAYGIIIGYLISASSFSMLFLGALLAQVLARKIDTPAHILGFALALLAMLFFGIPAIEIIGLAAFFGLAVFDELVLPKPYDLLTEWRVFLIAGAIAFAALGRWDYLVAILLFDAGYKASELLKKHI